MAAQPRTVRDALQGDARPVLLSRVGWTLCISVVGLALSAGSDLGADPVPYHRIAVKLGAAVAQAGAILAMVLVRHLAWRWVSATAVVAWVVACAATLVIGRYTADTAMPVFLLPVMVLGASIVFPWGTAAQAAATLVVGALLLPDARELGTNLLVSLYSVFAASIYLAAALQRQQFSRKALELLQAGQQRVLERIAADAPAETVFAEVLATVREQVPDSMCAIMLLDAEAREVSCAAATGLADAYRQALERIDATSGLARSVAAAALSGQREVIADIAADDRWAGGARALALSHAVRASWSEPILSAECTPLGLIVLYRSVAQLPSPRQRVLLATAARLLGILLERRAARQQIGALRERARRRASRGRAAEQRAGRRRAIRRSPRCARARSSSPT